MSHRINAGRLQSQRTGQLFRDLDNARMAMATLKESHFDYAAAAVKYATAFESFGLEVRTGVTEVLARRISVEEPSVRDASSWPLIIGQFAQQGGGTAVAA